MRCSGTLSLVEDLESKNYRIDELIELLGDLEAGVSRAETEVTTIAERTSLNEQNKLQMLHVRDCFIDFCLVHYLSTRMSSTCWCAGSRLRDSLSIPG